MQNRIRLQSVSSLPSESYTNFSLSRCKLREINWKNECRNTHGIWAGTHGGPGLPRFMTEKQPLQNSPDCGAKKELKITTQIQLLEGRLDESATYLLQWAQQRKDSIHLCCRKLGIQGLTKTIVIGIFKILHADCIQVLKLHFLRIEDLYFLNPYLRQMNNLLYLNLSHITDTLSIGDTEISLLSTFDCLQELCLNDVSFLCGNLKEFLRYLKTPLKSLTITNLNLSQSDLDFLPYCLNIFDLRSLNLANVNLCGLLLEPLGVFLERVRHTLKYLELDLCGLQDSQFNTLLWALSQCSHLRAVNFCGNDFSLLFLKQLLHHTAQLSHLRHEAYPAPKECYDSGVILPHRLENFCPELLDIISVKRMPKDVIFETTQCSSCGGFYVYYLETQSCIFVK